MADRSEIRIFPQTREAIEAQSHLKREELSQLKQNLKGLDSLRDGDMMDDPLLHRMLEEQGMTNAELKTILYLLSADVLTFDTEQVGNIETVQVGHRVVVTMRYADGETEKIFVTIGSTADARYLGTNRELFNGIEELLISDETPLGTAILGARVGDDISYGMGRDIHRGKVTSIEVSPLLIATQDDDGQE